jgi:type IX secretion system substrate protein
MPKNGNILHHDTISVEFREPGIDTVYLYVYRGTTVDTAFDVIYVRPLQYLNTLIDSAGILVETIRPAICIWYRDDVLMPGTIEPECEVCGQLAGCYHAIVGTIGCYFGITDTVCIFPAGVNTLAATTNIIQIYPNPATTTLTVKVPQDIAKITITNMVGQIVLTNYYHSDKAQVDVADLSAGIYLIKINGSEVRKFVKE